MVGQAPAHIVDSRESDMVNGQARQRLASRTFRSIIRIFRVSDPWGDVMDWGPASTNCCFHFAMRAETYAFMGKSRDLESTQFFRAKVPREILGSKHTISITKSKLISESLRRSGDNALVP